jgi:TolB protein
MTQDSTLIEAAIFPRLVVKVGGQVVQEVELRIELRIGRAEDNDLDLSDPKVSRHHARIHQQAASYVVTDLGSANGTRVNGVLLTGPHPLKHGDTISVGDTDLVYQEPGRGTDDTVKAAVPPGVQATATRKPAMVVPQPPVIPVDSGADRQGAPWLPIVLGVVGVIVIVAIVLVGASLLMPGLFGDVEPTEAATQTPQIVVATTAVPTATEAPAETPSASGPTSGAGSTPQAPSALDQQLDQAETLAQRSDFEGAMAILEDIAQQAPEDARPEAALAWVLIWDDEAADALAHAKRATELDPESSEAAAVLARAYIDTGDKSEALSEAQRAVDLDVGSAMAQAVLAEALLNNGQTQEAVDAADLALVQDINSAEAHRIRGWLYHIAENNMGRAAGELQIAAGLQPELWLRRHELGNLLLAAEDYTTAIMAFQDALGIRPKAVTYTAIGEAYYRLAQYDQARASLQQAVAAGAQDLNTYALLGATLAQQGRCDEAEEYYGQALDIDPTEPLALEAEGLCTGSRPSPTPSVTTVSASIPTPVSSPDAEATPQPTARPRPLPSLQGRIAFPVWDAERASYDVYVANVDGSGRTLVVEQMHQPAFSPDGTWLAVNGERDQQMNLFIVQPDGSGLKEISQHIEDNLPNWSPDGASLAFSSTMHGDKQSRVYVMDEVPFVGRQQEGRALNFGPDDVRGQYPAWTQDGRVVYQGCDLTVEPAKCGLYIMSSERGAQPTEQLTEDAEDTAPAVFGDQIAFTTNRDGNWEIYLMNLDGSELTRLTENAADDGLPVWSSDGEAIAFVSNQGGAWAVWAMRPDGSSRQKLFNLGGQGLAFNWQQERISWAP